MEVGPRIISYRSLQGGNVFKLVNEEAGKSNEIEWKIRGGHRFWVGPEDFGKPEGLTYAPDNAEVQYAIENEFAVTVSQVTRSPAVIRREMAISLDRTGPGVTVEHRLTNESDSPLVVAPWALSVMAPGGCAIIPQPAPGRHPDDYAPNRAIIAWPFTNLSDERLSLGRRSIRLSQKEGPPIKFGLRHTAGWIAYLHDDHIFVKSVPFLDGETYPDLGSNCEVFANAEFLELETLGPLKRISIQETVVHKESWALFTNPIAPENDDEGAFLERMQSYADQLPRA